MDTSKDERDRLDDAINRLERFLQDNGFDYGLAL